MVQKNFMSARALSMEEIENVNGGLSREAWYMFNKKEWMKLKKRQGAVRIAVAIDAMLSDVIEQFRY